MYIYERKSWPHFTWNTDKIQNLITKVLLAESSLFTILEQLGFDIKMDSFATALTDEIIKSSEIEGVILNTQEVRSSIINKLNLQNIDNNYSSQTSRYIDGIVDMALDATHNYKKKLTEKRLFSWHATLFPTGYSGMYQINVAKYRDGSSGPMRVISQKRFGEIEIIHYEAPNASLVKEYIKDFLKWIDEDNGVSYFIKAGVSHLWFVSIHPFEDGNGRIARAITDMLLSRAEDSPYRFYSLSSAIQKNRKAYYDILEKTQKGSLDITEWLEWFLESLISSINISKDTVLKILNKSKIWLEYNKFSLNPRQKKIISMLLDNFKGNLTSSKYAIICKCSQDTAIRDLSSLMSYGIIIKIGNARNIHYELKNKVI